MLSLRTYYKILYNFICVFCFKFGANLMATKNSSKGAFLSVVLCWMFYLFAYVIRVEPSVVAKSLMNEFGITSSVIGFLGSIAYLPYVVMQIPCGVITDKLGTKTVVLGSCAICSIGAFIFGSAGSVLQLEISRFLIGLSTAAAFLCCGKIATEFFDKRKYAMFMGIAMCMGCLGGIAGSSPTAYLVSKFGWRIATYAIATFGAILTIMVFFFMKKSPKVQTSEKTHILAGLKIIAKHPRAWVLGFYGAMTYLPLSALAELWVVPFMEHRYGVNTTKAAISSIIIFVGFAIGSVVSAWVAEKINSYKKTVIMFTFGIALAFSIAIYNDSISYDVCLLMLFIGGTCAGANNLVFPIAYDLVPATYGGTSTGFTNALVMSSGILFQPLLGKILDFVRNGLVDETGAPVYNLVMYRSAFLSVMVGMLLAIIAAFFINDLRHKDD